jgi:dephospho-CoA kinase
MTTIGLTGGIGSGKSTVASLFIAYGIPVYMADDASKRLVNTSPCLRSQLTDLLGHDIYGREGLNRRMMASLIFNDTHLLEKVNALIHPEVATDFDRWLARQTERYAVLESAILFESGFDRKVDIRLAVYAPEALRIQRVIAREQASEAEVRQRMNNQLPDELKIKSADYVIFNDGKQALIPQMENFLARLHNGK